MSASVFSDSSSDDDDDHTATTETSIVLGAAHGHTAPSVTLLPKEQSSSASIACQSSSFVADKRLVSADTHDMVERDGGVGGRIHTPPSGPHKSPIIDLTRNESTGGATRDASVAPRPAGGTTHEAMSPSQYSCYTPSQWALHEKVPSPCPSFDGHTTKNMLKRLTTAPTSDPVGRTPHNASPYHYGTPSVHLDANDDDCCTQSSDAPCAICTSPHVDERDVGVFCDGPCGLFTHLACYGLEAVPTTDKFFCESCAYYQGKNKKILRCVLCQRSGGMLRRSTCKQWVHQICVLFTPELVTDPTSMLPCNLREIDLDRESLRCVVCQKMGGANVQCFFGDCIASMHPYCAYKSGKQMVLRSDNEGYPTYELYCDKHMYRVLPGDIVSSTIPLPMVHEQTDKGRSPRAVAIKGAEDEIWNIDTIDSKPPRHREKKRLR